MWAKNQGFTIIELLVSIVVIGILSTIMVVSYTGIQQRSRDTDRASDITQIKLALDKYHAEKSQYPSVCSADGADCSVSLLAQELVPTHIKSIPHDPRNQADSATDYRYVRGAIDTNDPTSADSYALLVTYEAKAVCKTGVNVKSYWWGAGIPNC